MIYRRVGCLVVAEGENFIFKRLDKLKVFEQTGKVKSLRLIKVAIKKT